MWTSVPVARTVTKNTERCVIVRGYELTERGKIVIAGLIVLVLLLLSAILMLKAFANRSVTPPINQDPEASVALSPSNVEPPTETSNSPPPNGGGFALPDDSPPVVSSPDVTSPVASPTDTTPPAVTTPTTPIATPPISSAPIATPPINSADPGGGAVENGQETVSPPSTGPIGGNPSEGTLSFLFSADSQNELDADTISLLNDFLNSPKNTRGSMIAVETSSLSDNDAQKVISAISGAFAVYGIPENRLAHISIPSGAVGDTIKVDLYFIPASAK